MKERRIRVANPLPDEKGFRDIKQAMKLVRRGDAEWVDDNCIMYSLNYIEMRLRHQEVLGTGQSITGQYGPRQSGYRAVGGPGHKTMQLDIRLARFK